MKNGSASMGKDCVWLYICWATTISGRLPLEAMAAPEAISSACPTGTARNSRPKKATMRGRIT